MENLKNEQIKNTKMKFL